MVITFNGSTFPSGDTLRASKADFNVSNEADKLLSDFNWLKGEII